jgi:hypothetical protein
MKHIRTFENYRVIKNRQEIIKESVLQVNDIYKVKTMIDIPQSLVNSYVKKVKDNAGKNLRQFFGDVDIAEEIVKYINTNFMNVDQIPADLLMGGGQPSNSSDEGDNGSDVEVEASEESTPAPAQEAPTQQAPAPAPAQEAPAQEPAQEEENLELPSDEEGFEEPKEKSEEESTEGEEESTEEESEGEEESTEGEEESDDDLLI